MYDAASIFVFVKIDHQTMCFMMGINRDCIERAFFLYYIDLSIVNMWRFKLKKINQQLISFNNALTFCILVLCKEILKNSGFQVSGDKTKRTC